MVLGELEFQALPFKFGNLAAQEPGRYLRLLVVPLVLEELVLELLLFPPFEGAPAIEEAAPCVKFQELVII